MISASLLFKVSFWELISQNFVNISFLMSTKSGAPILESNILESQTLQNIHINAWSSSVCVFRFQIMHFEQLSIVEITLSRQPNGRINCVLLIGDKHLVGSRLGDYNYVSGEKMNSLGLKIFCFIAFYSWAHHQNGSAFWSSDSNAKIKIRKLRKWE